MNQQFDPNERSAERLLPLGKVLFGAGILLLIARALSVTSRFTWLPSFWHDNQPTWILIGIGLTGFGSWILWHSPIQRGTGWNPSLPGRRFKTALLYIGEGCHLCHDAADLLAQYQAWLPEVHLVDIRSDPGLTSDYCNCIPVFVLDGKVRFRGHINETLLRRLIEGTPPIQLE